MHDCMWLFRHHLELWSLLVWKKMPRLIGHSTNPSACEKAMIFHVKRFVKKTTTTKQPIVQQDAVRGRWETEENRMEGKKLRALCRAVLDRMAADLGINGLLKSHSIGQISPRLYNQLVLIWMELKKPAHWLVKGLTAHFLSSAQSSECTDRTHPIPFWAPPRYKHKTEQLFWIYPASCIPIKF